MIIEGGLVTAVKKQIPVEDGLFTWPSEQPSLIGSRCKSCGHYFFPRIKICQNPDCNEKEVEDVLLGRRGKLWSYTIQHYAPPPPYHGPVPLTIGLMELSEEKLRIMGQLVEGIKPEDIKIGMELELVVEKLFDDEEGNEVMTWRFRPA